MTNKKHRQMEWRPERSQGCFVGNINGEGSKPEEKPPETSDFGSFWMKNGEKW